MNKAALLSILTVLFLSLSSHAQADWRDFDHHQAMEKGKRGLINIVTAPLEIPHQIKKEAQEHGLKDNAGLPILGGAVKGLVMTVARLGSGLWDVVTLNINYPDNFEPLLKPDYVCDKE